MKATYLINIGFESIKFVLKNNKQFFKLALLPTIISVAALALWDVLTADVDAYSPFDTVVDLILFFILFFILIPFNVVWIKFILNKQKSFRYRDSLVWDSVCLQYLVQSIKITSLRVLYYLVGALAFWLLGVKFQIGYFMIFPILGFLLLGTVLMRASLIVPACVDGKKLSIKSALSKTKNLTIPLLLLDITFTISLFVAILIITLPAVPAIVFGLHAKVSYISFIGSLVGIALCLFLLLTFYLAVVSGYSALLYRKLIKNKGSGEL